jgi:hypothetical protein
MDLQSILKRVERAFSGGVLYSVPLFPSVVTFILALVASVIVNTAALDVCPDRIRTYLIGSVIVSYLLPALYAAALLGPANKATQRNLTFYCCWWIIAFCWTIYGSTTLGDTTSSCVSITVAVSQSHSHLSHRVSHLSVSLCLSLSRCLSVSLSLCLALSLSRSLSVSLSLCLAVSLSRCLSVSLSLCLAVSLSRCLSVSLSLCLSVSLSRCLAVSLSRCLSVSLSLCLAVSLSRCLSVSLILSLSLSLSLSRCLSLAVSLSRCLSVSLSLSRCLSLAVSLSLSLSRLCIQRAGSMYKMTVGLNVVHYIFILFFLLGAVYLVYRVPSSALKRSLSSQHDIGIVDNTEQQPDSNNDDDDFKAI